MGAVNLDRDLAQAELGCELLVGPTGHDKVHDLSLSRRERIEAVLELGDGLPVPAPGAVALDAELHCIKELLIAQVTAPVRWEETVRALGGFAPDLALEVGPGQTLSGLMRRILPELVTIAAGDAPGVARTREALG